MTKEEFQEKDMLLQAEIAEYENNSADLGLQIATNNRKIACLKWQRVKLNNEYLLSKN